MRRRWRRAKNCSASRPVPGFRGPDATLEEAEEGREEEAARPRRGAGGGSGASRAREPGWISQRDALGRAESGGERREEEGIAGLEDRDLGAGGGGGVLRGEEAWVHSLRA